MNIREITAYDRAITEFLIVEKTKEISNSPVRFNEIQKRLQGVENGIFDGVKKMDKFTVSIEDLQNMFKK